MHKQWFASGNHLASRIRIEFRVELDLCKSSRTRIGPWPHYKMLVCVVHGCPATLHCWWRRHDGSHCLRCAMRVQRCITPRLEHLVPAAQHRRVETWQPHRDARRRLLGREGELLAWKPRPRPRPLFGGEAPCWPCGVALAFHPGERTAVAERPSLAAAGTAARVLCLSLVFVHISWVWFIYMYQLSKSKQFTF